MSDGRPLARGDVVLVRFPFTDRSSDRVRPALVVGRVAGEDVILAFITSHLASADSQSSPLLAPGDPEFAATGLKVPSAVRMDKIATLHRRLVRRRLGLTGPGTLVAIATRLRYVLDLPNPQILSAESAVWLTATGATGRSAESPTGDSDEPRFRIRPGRETVSRLSESAD